MPQRSSRRGRTNGEHLQNMIAPALYVYDSINVQGDQVVGVY